MKKQQNGFGVVEIILTILVIAIIAGVGVYAWRANQDKITTTTDMPAATGTSSNEPAAVDEYAGWKTYTSKGEGFSFKYPADWTLKVGAANNQGKLDASIDAASVTGPNNFSVGYSLAKPSGITCANCSFTKLGEVALKNNQPGYVVVSSNTVNGNIQEQHLGISKSATYGGQNDHLLPYYTSFTDAGKSVQWSGGYPACNDSSPCSSVTLDDFLSRDEVKIGEKILKSLTY